MKMNMKLLELQKIVEYQSEILNNNKHQNTMTWKMPKYLWSNLMRCSHRK